MNLIIDAGNSQIKWALFERGEIRKGGVQADWNDLMTPEWAEGLHQVSRAMYASTRHISPRWPAFLEQNGVQALQMRHDLAFPFAISYATPETLGLDRVAAIAGAQASFPASNVLVIDLGTAITFDLLTADGVFAGGNISPGMRIRFESLHRFTDQLPLVSPDERMWEPGKSTSEALQAGVQSGILFEVMGYINSLKNKYNELVIILTGGDAGFFVKKLKKTIFVDPDLVLKGLNHILDYQGEVQGGW